MQNAKLRIQMKMKICRVTKQMFAKYYCLFQLGVNAKINNAKRKLKILMKMKKNFPCDKTNVCQGPIAKWLNTNLKSDAMVSFKDTRISFLTEGWCKISKSFL